MLLGCQHFNQVNAMEIRMSSSFDELTEDDLAIIPINLDALIEYSDPSESRQTIPPISEVGDCCEDCIELQAKWEAIDN